MVQYKHIIITLFLSFLPLVTVWGQVPHEFGTLSEGDIEWYKFEPEGDVAELWTCFTLEEPADVWLTLKKLNASSSGLFVFDSEENLIAIKDVDSSDNEIKAYVNLPAGNYQCFVDFAIQEYMELGIEVKASDLDL